MSALVRETSLAQGGQVDWGKCVYCGGVEKWVVFIAHLHIPGSVPVSCSELHFRVKVKQRKERDRARVRTGIGGRNPLHWLPTEGLSERRNADCEQWANNAENARVKDYRVLMCVSLLSGEYLSDFGEFLQGIF